MELRKLSLVLLLIVSVSNEGLIARSMLRQRRQFQLKPQNKIIRSNVVELNILYDISVPGQTHRISFVAILPETIPDKQKILGVKYSQKPSRIFNKNGNRYAEFIFIKPDRQEKVEINIKAELFKYDLFTAREKNGFDDYEYMGFRNFLEEEMTINILHKLTLTKSLK